MSPDDPRHGTTRGHAAGCRAHCCRQARNTDEARRRKYRQALGITRSVDATGTRRRIHALMAIGWTSGHLAARCGWTHGNAILEIAQRRYVYTGTAKTIAALYDELSMTPGPSDSSRRRAIRKGWAPPLAWDDIDNDPSPVGDGCTHTGCGLKVVRKGLCDKHLRAAPRTGQAWANDVDPIVVDRLLDGQRVVSTRAEKDEALQRWLAAGRSERSFCQLHDLKEGRYGKGAAA